MILDINYAIYARKDNPDRTWISTKRTYAAKGLKTNLKGVVCLVKPDPFHSRKINLKEIIEEYKFSKLKCYVLIVSTQFPGYHKRKGQETRFTYKIALDEKLHTLRANFELWQKRIAEINAGKAYLSVRKWEGKPYNSPQKELYKYFQVGLQKLQVTPAGDFVVDGFLQCNKFIETLAKNDGLTVEDFREWFKKGIKGAFAIIHFTRFRY